VIPLFPQKRKFQQQERGSASCSNSRREPVA